MTTTITNHLSSALSVLRSRSRELEAEKVGVEADIRCIEDLIARHTKGHELPDEKAKDWALSLVQASAVPTTVREWALAELADGREKAISTMRTKYRKAFPNYSAQALNVTLGNAVRDGQVRRTGAGIYQIARKVA